MINVIWTTEYCPFCDLVKELMDDRGISYETRLVDEVNWKLEQMIEEAPKATTYPQVFIEGLHIGGADDLKAFFTLREMSLGL